MQFWKNLSHLTLPETQNLNALGDKSGLKLLQKRRKGQYQPE